MGLLSGDEAAMARNGGGERERDRDRDREREGERERRRRGRNSWAPCVALLLCCPMIPLFPEFLMASSSSGCCRENPFDCVVLEKSALVDAADHAMSKKSAKARTGFLLEHTALLDDDVEPFEVLAGGRLGAALVAALHVMGAPASDFKAWKGVQEAFPWMKEEDGDDDDKAEEGAADAAPAWTETGVLQLGDSTGGDEGGSSSGSGSSSCLAGEARVILARMLEGEYERKFGSQGLEEDEAQLVDAEKRPLESSGSDGSTCHAAALRAGLTLRLGEKKVIKEALAALGVPGDKAASGGDGREHEGPSSKRAKAS